MAIGTYQRRAARRRNWRVQGAKWLGVAGVLGGVAWAAQDWARRDARGDLDRAHATIEELRGALAQSADDIGGLEVELDATRETVAEWRARYDADAPSGAELALWRAAKAKIAEGASAEKVMLAVEAVSARERRCEPTIVTKRFLVETPATTEGVRAAEFAEGALTLSARGAAPEAAAGASAAWFDPDQPVEVAFTRIGGAVVRAEGVMPLFRSLVVGREELRFAIRPAGQGWATASVQVCPLTQAEAEALERPTPEPQAPEPPAPAPAEAADPADPAPDASQDAQDPAQRELRSGARPAMARDQPGAPRPRPPQ